jgi:hypothetical protein
MIKLKSGKHVEYDENFDIFFMNLLENIIAEAKENLDLDENFDQSGDSKNERLVREIMDNCIFVTHQLFEISREDENLSKFIVTGFLFNSIMLTLTHSNISGNVLDDLADEKDPEDDDGTVH